MIRIALASAASSSRQVLFRARPVSFIMSRFQSTSTNGIHMIKDESTLKIRSPLLQNIRTSKFRLSNGLEVFAISDPETPESGAAMTVETGSWNDEPDAQGTAHFLEHMLFLGTKKFPDEAEYSRFIRDHGGQMNAYTSSDHTTYMFSVTNESFKDALERFSPFFYAPLFNSNCIEREMNAVDEEFRKNISDDGWRQHHVMKELAKPSHPFSFFNTGNLESMKLISQDRLQQWYRRYYVAPAMRLTMYGQQPVETLQQYAQHLFHHIPTTITDGEQPDQVRERTKIRVDRHLYDDSLRGTWIHVVPLKSLREISLVWEIDERFTDLKTKAASQVAFVLGHEAEGSLYASLHRDDLIEGLSAGPSHSGAQNYSFQITLRLTDKGLRERVHVVERVFAAIASFAAKAPFPSYPFDELNTMARTKFEFQTRSGIFNAVTRHAQLLRDESLSTYPMQSILMTSFDAALIQQLWQELTPQNVFIEMTAPLFDGASEKDFRKEKHMGALYKVTPFSAEERHRYDAARTSSQHSVRFPQPNQFIPTKLEPLPPHAIIPQPPVLSPLPVVKDARGHVLLLKDQLFGNPVVSWSFRLHTPRIRGDDVKSVVRSELLVKMVQEQLRIPTYSASYAGLSFSIFATLTGIGMALNGYSDKSVEFWRLCVDLVSKATIDPEAFSRCHAQILRSYENALQNLAVRQALNAAIRGQMARPVTIQDKIQAIKEVTIDDLKTFQKDLFKQLYVEAILTGQTDQQMASDVFDVLWTRFSPQTIEYSVTEKPKLRNNLYAGSWLIEKSNIVHGNAAALLCDFGLATIENKVLVQMIATALEEPFYSELRTKQQTGYIVTASQYTLQNQRCYVYLASQSSIVTSDDLLKRYEAFLKEILSQWESGSGDIQQRFDNLRQAMETQLSQPYRNLAELAGALESMAFDRFESYEDRQKALHLIKKVKLQDFIETAVSHLDVSRNTARSHIQFIGLQRNEIQSKL